MGWVVGKRQEWCSQPRAESFHNSSHNRDDDRPVISDFQSPSHVNHRLLAEKSS